MIRAVLWAGTCLGLVVACDTPLPLNNASHSISAPTGQSELVEIRSYFRSGSAVSEVPGANCDLQVGTRTFRVVTPTQVQLGTNVDETTLISLHCSKAIGAKVEAKENKRILGDLRVPEDRVFPKRLGVIFE